MLNIAVVGDGNANRKTYNPAIEVGAAIADSKSVLICGGLGGVMEGSAKGAKERGGLTVGILPGESSKEANHYIDIKIATGLGHARNAIVARAADAVIAVGGEYGTLSEVALALKMGKPVVYLETSGGILRDSEIKGVIKAKTPIDAVNIAIQKGKALLG